MYLNFILNSNFKQMSHSSFGVKISGKVSGDTAALGRIWKSCRLSLLFLHVS